MTQTHSSDVASLTHTHCCSCMNSQRYILWIDSYSQNEYESETDQKYWQFCKTFTDKAEGKVESLRVYSSKVKAAWVEALFTSAAVNNLTLRSCCYSRTELHFTSLHTSDTSLKTNPVSTSCTLNTQEHDGTDFAAVFAITWNTPEKDRQRDRGRECNESPVIFWWQQWHHVCLLGNSPNISAIL